MAAAELLEMYANRGNAEAAALLVHEVECHTNSLDHAVASNCHAALAVWYRDCVGIFTKAEQHFGAALDRLQHLAGPGALRAISDMLCDRAVNLRKAGDLDKACKLAEEAMRVVHEKFGDKDRDMARPLFTLGATLAEQAEWSDALPHLHKSLDNLHENGDETSWVVASCTMTVGRCLRNLGKPRDAIVQFSKAYDVWVAALGEHFWRIVLCLIEEARCHMSLDDLSKARELLNRAERILQ